MDLGFRAEQLWLRALSQKCGLPVTRPPPLGEGQSQLDTPDGLGQCLGPTSDGQLQRVTQRQGSVDSGQLPVLCEDNRSRLG